MLPVPVVAKFVAHTVQLVTGVTLWAVSTSELGGDESFLSLGLFVAGAGGASAALVASWRLIRMTRAAADTSDDLNRETIDRLRADNERHLVRNNELEHVVEKLRAEVAELHTALKQERRLRDELRENVYALREKLANQGVEL